MFSFIKQVFIVLMSFSGSLDSIVYAQNIYPYIINNLINLHPNEYVQRLIHYPFAVNLNICIEIFNTLNYFSNRVCVPNKTKNLNLELFDMTTGVNESKTLTNIYHANVRTFILLVKVE